MIENDIFGGAARFKGNQGYQWLKINVDARRAITIVYFKPQI